MIKRREFFALFALTIVFSYTIAIGTTFNGVLTPELHIPTLIMTGIIVSAWLLIHWKRGWVWHRTPLDGVMMIWLAAFSLSFIANLDSWRRITIGLWYVSAYIGVWYMLHDIIANEGISRQTFVDAFLICGLIILIFGFVQSRSWFPSLPLMLSRTIPWSLPRPVSIFGNPNTLANFLVVLTPIALARTVSARRNWVMVAYSLASLLLLLLTYSRGAWIGMAAGLLVWGALFLAQRNMLSLQSLKTGWAKIGRGLRLLMVGTALAGSLVSIVILLILLRSLNEAGRSTDLRTDIYKTAITMFSEKPLTGYGLFTFGRGLVRLQSVPPTTPHSHAHDAPLMIAAELGIVGLVALFSTLAVMVWGARRNWRDMTDRQRILFSGATAAVVAFAGHQLTDIPATAPTIVVTGLIALALMLTPIKPQPISSRFRRIEHPLAMAGLWIVLFASGFWSNRIYTDYVNALLYGSRSHDFRGAAEQMQPAIDADPALSLYYKEQGFLFGLAANEGDQDAARQGIAVYQKFIAQEPDYAIVWANMAALQWGLGQQDAGFQSMQQALKLAPQAWQFAVGLGQYAEVLGKTDVARNAFEQAIALYPDVTLLPEMESFQRDDLDLTIPARVVVLVQEGNVGQAAKIWAENPQPGTTTTYVIDALFAIANKDQVNAEASLDKARKAITWDGEQALLCIGKARLAQEQGNETAANIELQTAHQLLERDVFEGDFTYGISVAYAQYLRLGIPRQFLPQVYFPVDDPVLSYLLNHTQTTGANTSS